LLWLQRVLGACSGGQVFHLQLAASVPHDFTDLANEFMASYWWFLHGFLPGAYLFWGSIGAECLLMGQDGRLLLARTPI
jgi:hypothetical protein